MRILVLSSNQPNFEHSHAHHTVLAVLLEALAKLGHAVGWTVAGYDEPLDETALQRLQEIGVHYLGDFSAELESGPDSKLGRVATNLRKVFIPRINDDLPSFRTPDRVLARLQEFEFDSILLFWDTWFEHLVPTMSGLSVFAYLARPRYAAPMSRLENRLASKNTSSPIRRWMLYRLIQHQKLRHLKRVQRLRAVSNICAVDAADYRVSGIACSYIPNTWPDNFGLNWLEKRLDAESEETVFGILGNIGTLHTTGNRFGMTFLATEVLPRLERLLSREDWKINICGGGELVPSLQEQLNHPRVVVKGFVPDIDQEMLRNSIFLLCNNAGPYSGGYTRVVYAMSSGACLIGHTRLAESMPEVVHGQNALLGENGTEIAALVAEASLDPDLRHRIGAAARRTYENNYRPEVVARQIIDLMNSTSF